MSATKSAAGLLLSVSLLAGLPAIPGGPAQAQSLRNGATPAEFPPASYAGTQYVDSRGCVYIRAGIDGNVTWVPRVSRDRKLVCGYTPTGTATTAQTQPTAPSQPVEQITIAPIAPTTSGPTTNGPTTFGPTTAGPTTAPASAPAAAPDASPQAGTTTAAAPSAQPQPSLFGTTSMRAPSPAPPPTVFETTRDDPSPAPRSAPQPRPALFGSASTREPSPAPPPTVFQTTRSDPPPAPVRAPATVRSPATATATATRVAPAPTTTARVAPPPATPVYGTPQPAVTGTAAAGTAAIGPNTRVIPLHVYQQRANATDLPVPKGYRPVWDDDRLNPHRAERTLAPAQQRAAVVPPGYRPAWTDGRLNPDRGERTATGNAQTAAIWQDGVPRQIVLPQNVPVIRVQRGRVQSRDTSASVTDPLYGGVAAKTATAPAAAPAQPQRQIQAKQPQAKAAPSYVRVGAFHSEDDARRAARQLARASGLTMRLGTAKKGNQTYKLVLAGPYQDAGAAQAALNRVRGAGYANARLMR